MSNERGGCGCLGLLILWAVMWWMGIPGWQAFLLLTLIAVMF